MAKDRDAWTVHVNRARKGRDAPSPEVGSPGRARTCDILINSQALYRLSYRGIKQLQTARAILPRGMLPRARLAPRCALPFASSAAPDRTAGRHLECARDPIVDDQHDGDTIATVDGRGPSVPLARAQKGPRRHNGQDVACTVMVHPRAADRGLALGREERGGRLEEGSQIWALAQPAPAAGDLQGRRERLTLSRAGMHGRSSAPRGGREVA